MATKSLLYLTESICMSWLLRKMGVCKSLYLNSTHCVVGVFTRERAGLREAPPPSRHVDRVCDRLLPLTEFLSLSQLCGCIVFSAPLPGPFHSSVRGGMRVVAFVLESIRGPGRWATSAWACPWFTAASPRLVWCIARASLKDNFSVMLIVCCL